jgi:hypothetical protein
MRAFFILFSLLLIATSEMAQAIPGPPSDDWHIYSANRNCGATPIDRASQEVVDAYEQAQGCAARDENSLSSYWLPRCESDYGRCDFFASENIPPYQSGTYLGQAQFTTRYVEHLYYYTGPDNKEVCAEQGKNFDPYADEGAQCIKTCPSGSSLDGICLKAPDEDENEPECNADNPEYVGSIGSGDFASPICGNPQNNCPADSTFGLIQKGNTTVQGCVPNEYNPPQCSGSDVLVVDEWGGHSCLPVSDTNNPNGDSNDDTSDGDSDGDGEADTNGMAGQLQDIKKKLDRGNTNTKNIDETLKGLGKSIKDGTSAITDAIGNIPGGGGGGNGDGGDGGDGEEQDPPVTWSGDPIDTELTDPEDDYNQVMADYQAKITEIKNEVQAMFSTNLTGGGAVVDNTKTIMGVDVNFSLNRFLPGLDILGAIVLFCAAFISAGILFTSRG